jgi:hypothetical protein
MGKPGEEKIDDVRRRLLRRGVYVAPVVLAVIAVRNAGAQGVSGPAMGNMGNSGMDKAGLFG